MKNIALFALCSLIWGTTWYAVTFQVDTVHPVAAIAHRYTLAAVLLFIFGMFIKRNTRFRLSRLQHLFIALNGIATFCLSYLMAYMSQQYLTSGIISVLFSMFIFANIVNQALFFKISVKKNVVLGGVVCLVGMAMIFYKEAVATSFQPEIMIGFAFALTAVYCGSLGNMLVIRNKREDTPIFEGNMYAMGYGCIAIYAIAFVFDVPLTPDVTLSYTISLLYLAVFGSIVAFGAFFMLIGNIGADKAAYTTVIAPIIALALSTLFEGYEWTALAMLGVVFALSGNVIALWRTKS